jgi:hypothetical protein
MCGLHPDDCQDIALSIAAASVWIASPKGSTKESHEAAEKVRLAVQDVLDNKSGQDLLEELTEGERAHLRREPAMMRVWYGHAIHRATGKALDRMYRGEFKYKTSHGVDYEYRGGRAAVELTTAGQIDSHIARGGPTWPQYTSLTVSPYRWVSGRRRTVSDDVYLDRVDLSGVDCSGNPGKWWSVGESTLTRCRFENMKIDYFCFGAGVEMSEYVDCVFDGSRIKAMSPGRARFVRCSFRNVSFD